MAGSAEDGVQVTGGGSGAKRKCCSVKALQIVIFLLIFIIILLLIFLWLFAFPGLKDECITTECLLAASEVKKNINFSVDPCQDFYAFACGKFIATQRIPPSKMAQTTINILRDKVNQRVKDILASNTNVTDRDVNKQLAKSRKVYRRCLESELFGSSKEILAKLFAAFGPLPFLQDMQLSNKQFMMQMINGSALGVELLFGTSNSIDSFDTTRYRLVIYEAVQSPMLMTRFDFLSDDPGAVRKRNAYKKFLNSVLKEVYRLFRGPEKIKVDAILEAQISIVRATQTLLQKRNDSAQAQMTVRELIAKKTWKKFDWAGYFEGLGNFTGNKKFFANLDQKITIQGLDYLMKVDEMFVTIPDLNKIVGQIATFELVVRVMDHLRYDFRLLHETFNKESGGTFKFFSREKICNDYVLGNFNKVISRVYSDLYFDKDAKKSAEDMIEAIRAAFDRGLDRVSWIDDKTRSLSKEKLKLIIPKIGFDPELLDPKTFQKDEFPNYDDFVSSMIQVQFQKAKMPYKLVTAKIDRTKKYYLDSLRVNAMYMPDLNTIEFPMAILTAPLYNKNSPSSMNFGGVGSVIGHELLHAFDDRGSKRDKFGNLATWWPANIRSTFTERTTCLVKQYNAYKTPYGMSLNGRLTLPENIADQAGMKYSYMAYEQQVKEGKASMEGLPGLPYNGKQLFFINFAQMYCSAVTKMYWETRVRQSVHSPYKFRVVGVLSTFPAFKQAFNCPASSPMVADGCPIW